MPWPPTTAAYERAFELVDLGRYSLNSIVVAAVTVPLTLLVASWAGFAMTRLAARTARALIAVSLVALMVPLTALLVPRFILFRELGLIDTYAPLVASSLVATSPFYVLLYYWGFRRLPADVVDAARLEGLGPLARLVARRDAARPAADGRGRRARVRVQLEQLPRPARLPGRRRALHAPARPALAGHARASRTTRSSSPERWRPRCR